MKKRKKEEEVEKNDYDPKSVNVFVGLEPSNHLADESRTHSLIH